MPKLIVKSGYTIDVQHFINSLEYMGNKIADQQITFTDGTTQDFAGCEKIDFDKLDRNTIESIYLSFKDGGGKSISVESYEKKMKSHKNVTVERVIEEIPDSSVVLGTTPRKLQELDLFKYLSYVGERPGVVKDNDCGLFSLAGAVRPNVAEQMAKDDKPARAWMHIISMSTDDAQRLGYDNCAAWEDLVISKAPDIAKAYNISLENLRLYGGFHANTDNPHVHISFYSVSPSEGYVKNMSKATKEIKSLFTNAIFRDDVTEIKQAISIKRDEMVDALNVVLERTDISKTYQDKLCAIAAALPDKGKPQYKFMPWQTKAMVKELLSDMLQDEALQPLYSGYLDAYEEYARVYADNPDVISQQRFNAHNKLIGARDRNAWRNLHNIIVTSAYEIKLVKSILYQNEFATALRDEIKGVIMTALCTLSSDSQPSKLRALMSELNSSSELERESIQKNLIDNILQIPKVDRAADALWKNFKAKYETIFNQEPTREQFEQLAFYDRYTGVASTATFLASIMDSITNRHILQVAQNMFRGIATALYKSTNSTKQASLARADGQLSGHGKLTQMRGSLSAKKENDVERMDWN